MHGVLRGVKTDGGNLRDSASGRNLVDGSMVHYAEDMEVGDLHERDLIAYLNLKYPQERWEQWNQGEKPCEIDSSSLLTSSY